MQTLTGQFLFNKRQVTKSNPDKQSFHKFQEHSGKYFLETLCSSLLIQLSRHCGILRLFKNAVSTVCVVQTRMIVERMYRILCKARILKKIILVYLKFLRKFWKILKSSISIADGKTIDSCLGAIAILNLTGTYIIF